MTKRHRMGLFALCLLLAVCQMPAAAQPAQRQVVRVGFFAFDGYHMQDKNGVRSGYGYELLQRMVGYTNWQLEFVGYDKSWGEMLEMLARGEIDLLTSAQKTPERLERFDFSNDVIGTSVGILTTNAGDTQYLTDDYAAWNGMRVGMLKNNSRNDGFAAFAARHGFAYAPVYFDDVQTMLDALKIHKSVDAVVSSNLRAIRDEWTLAQFDASSFYIIVKKGNAELLSQIDDVLDELFSVEPGLRTRLMNKYYLPDSGEKIAFTASERAYIRSAGDEPLTAILNPDRAPYSFLQDGQLTGILYDLANEIIARSGLKIQFKPLATRAAYNRCVEAGDYDIRFDAGYRLLQADEGHHRLTAVYLEAPISRLYLRQTPAFKTAALLKSGVIAEVLRERLTELGTELVYYESTQEVIDAVLTGRQDVAYLNSNAAMLAVQSEPTNALISEELYGFVSPYCIELGDKADPLLYAILSKTISSISKAQTDEINQRYIAYTQAPFTLLGYLYDYPAHVLIAVLLFFMVTALMYLAVHQTKKRKRAAAALVEEARRNDLLRNALNTAENADAAKSQFLSRMSHEMRTPLNAIIGFLTLSRNADMPTLRTYLQNSEIAARQLLAVINDVLDMSAIESGKFKIANTPFDFKQTLHAVTNIYLPLCQQKGLDYETKIESEVDEWLVGDPLRVNQILMNLLGNAYKFTSKGHVWLKISQRPSQGQRVFIHMEVSDTGCGMSEDMQARVFKPFEQEDEKTALKYGGSGLGLSIVKNLVSMMNGAIRVESRLGGGTTFAVDLPFGTCGEHPFARLPVDRARLRALVVDDTPEERSYLSSVLTRIGIRHTCVADCDAALEALREGGAQNDPYSVCLVDWRMPQIDGIETTRRIRAQYGEDMIVIVVSAYEQQHAYETATKAGANLFVNKPIFPSTLFDLFMKLTGGQIGRDKADLNATPDLEGRRVLLAEDLEMNRVVAEGLLDLLGVKCQSVENGKEAVETFEASEPGRFDAILMDIKMPVMNGYEAAMTIRKSAHPQAKTIPIIAMTADAFSEDIAKALSSGMNAHIAKPIGTDALASTLASAFAADPGEK